MMGKTTVTIRFVSLRPQPDGSFRPRYIPGPRHRKLGLKGEDLQHPDGAWFTLDQCAAWSAERQRLVETLEGAAPRQRRKLVRGTGGITVAELFERWFLEPRLNGQAQVEGKKQRPALAASTVAYYHAGAKRLEELDDGRIWLSPAAAITASVIGNPERGVLHRIEVQRGLHVALCVRATLSAAFGWAKGRGLVSANPARGLDYHMPAPAPRIRYGSIAEMQALVAAADAIGRPDVGDAIVLGLWTGQRQGDRLALIDPQVTGDGIRFRQSKKHGQPLLIPAAPELAARLEAARLRRRGWRVNYPHVVLDEVARAPFQRDWYKKLFARVRLAAAHGVLADGTVPATPLDARAAARAQWRLAPAPSLADFHDQDLRDTAVTWLALAHCNKFEISAITGHSLKTVDEILKHYLGLHPELARSAIGKLVAWYETQEGEGA